MRDQGEPNSGCRDEAKLDFLRAVRDDPMLGRASRALRGLRPVRVATVAQALLRAYCGQLIEAKRARRLEQTIIRSICTRSPVISFASGFG